MDLSDPVNAFCDYGLVSLPSRVGPLDDLSFGVKDLFDIAGLPTGAGSPAWLATHPVPAATAPAVQRLLDAGARLLGKTRTDELAWSLNGQNAHYGTPVNTAAPGRIPGGSSSGSAAATAAGLVDFALGSDTGGSVRLPASYCGIYGLRTTHGRVPVEGAVPLSPSFDTVGWFARDPVVLARVGAVILGSGGPAAGPTKVMIAEDLFAFAGESVSAALGPAVARFESMFGPAPRITVAGDRLEDWRDAFRVLQAAEAWRSHGEWFSVAKPDLGPGIRERFAAAAQLDPAGVVEAQVMRETIRRRLLDLMGPGTVLIAPVTPGIAPLLTTSAPDLEAFRAKALAILCLAGHAGLPQISLPLGHLDGCPLGLGLIGAPGEDERLLEMACRLA